jgi:hypothetical protein
MEKQLSPSTKAAATRAANIARRARLDAHRAEVAAIVASRTCPICGGLLRRNLALAGWWQCQQYGAEGFRADASKPSCSWQGFTE